jgi:hypothetical protein
VTNCNEMQVAETDRVLPFALALVVRTDNQATSPRTSEAVCNQDRCLLVDVSLFVHVDNTHLAGSIPAAPIPVGAAAVSRLRAIVVGEGGRARVTMAYPSPMRMPRNPAHAN